MQRARMSFAFLALAASVVACHVILGIGDEDFRYLAPDSQDAAGEDVPARCPVGRAPPEPPPGADLGESLPPLVFAFSHVDFLAKTDGGTIDGYDLDGKCTCDARDTSSNAARRTCVPPDAADEPCDEDGGVDNALARALRQFTTVAEAFGVDLSDPVDIACGRQTVLVILRNYNGQANDPDVFLSLIPSYGIFQRSDAELDGGGAIPDAGCRSFDAGPFPARFDGTDKWSHLPSHVDEFDVPIIRIAGYVRDFQLSLNRRDLLAPETVVPLSLGSRIFTVATPTVTARIVPLDEHGADLRVLDDGGVVSPGSDTPRSAYGFRLTDGIMAGRMRTSDLLAGLGSLRLSRDRDDYLCSHAFYAQIKDVLCSSVDTTSRPDLDFMGHACDAVSLGVRFEATRALLGQAYEPPEDATDAGCESFQDDCMRRAAGPTR